jgi:hypothetical protein
MSSDHVQGTHVQPLTQLQVRRCSFMHSANVASSTLCEADDVHEVEDG